MNCLYLIIKVWAIFCVSTVGAKVPLFKVDSGGSNVVLYTVCIPQPKRRKALNFTVLPYNFNAIENRYMVLSRKLKLNIILKLIIVKLNIK